MSVDSASPKRRDDELACAPSGELRFVRGDSTTRSAARRAFGQSFGHGLLHLATTGAHAEVSASVAFG